MNEWLLSLRTGDYVGIISRTGDTFPSRIGKMTDRRIYTEDGVFSRDTGRSVPKAAERELYRLGNNDLDYNEARHRFHSLLASRVPDMEQYVEMIAIMERESCS